MNTTTLILVIVIFKTNEKFKRSVLPSTVFIVIMFIRLNCWANVINYVHIDSLFLK